ncbi:YraN family protein [Candidatus Oleimmundimicrobium sp.]|uniref:YraN family protein n=1 Tax=Candidatus Oleimmundimicrobium sp. TaxID=3060597 RepID=UPI0027268919|nr:YraN family protein [Candidatus Oleimmundimicrobium sp.]MDO8885368.1 YraN family protein [Candidatus Oleimmundimicrobium sp.]
MSFLGNKGEKLACRYLKRKGYNILQCNYRCKIGEIDIIAQKNEYLIFIEVKTRSSREFGEPFEAVTIYKQERLRRLAESYIVNNQDDKLNYRFDVISILFEDKKPAIEHIENAF